jgi:hypothetical protein
MANKLIYQVNIIDPLVGTRSPLYEWCIDSVKKYCEKHSIDHIVQTEPILKIGPLNWETSNRHENCRKRGFLPIYEKENAFAYFDRYDQIAIVDSDIYIRDTAPNIFNELKDDIDFAGVIEREMPITPEYQNKIKNYSASQYQWLHEKGYANFMPNNFGYEFYNMGLMVMNKTIQKYLLGQTPKQFLRRKKFQPFVDGFGAWKWSTDQTLLNFWVRNSGMKCNHLNWKWNGLIDGIEEHKIKDVHFLHFFKRNGKTSEIEQLKKLV